MLRKLTIALNIIWVLFGTLSLLDEFDSERFIYAFLFFCTVPILTLFYLLGNPDFKEARHLTIALNVLGALFFNYALIGTIMDGDFFRYDESLILLNAGVTTIVTLWYLLGDSKSKVFAPLSLLPTDKDTRKDLLVFTIKGLIICLLILLTLYLMEVLDLRFEIYNRGSLYIDGID
tara:strand:- start:97 stop:624 length:528 start_codon:yes stop_codon:yes gene_type:complete